MRAIVVEDGEPRRLGLAEVPKPTPGSGEMLVAVRAISLNHGEVRLTLKEAGLEGPLGWDFAGEVIAAPEGCGFRPGDPVAGFVFGGAWAEFVSIAPSAVAKLPPQVGFAEASTLPVAGMTAALALTKREALTGLSLEGARVLVTGATGGVGMFAVQLAAIAGAEVVALVRDSAHGDRLRRLGAATIVDGLDAARAAGRYDLVVEAIGGAVLGEVLGMLATRGVCVLVGDAGGPLTTFDGNAFRWAGGVSGTTLYGFFLVDELTRTSATSVLADLLRHVADGKLDPIIEAPKRSWTEIDAVARALLDRRFIGKAVLTVT